jgi:hypothetical protein
MAFESGRGGSRQCVSETMETASAVDDHECISVSGPGFGKDPRVPQKRKCTHVPRSKGRTPDPVQKIQSSALTHESSRVPLTTLQRSPIKFRQCPRYRSDRALFAYAGLILVGHRFTEWTPASP